MNLKTDNGLKDNVHMWTLSFKDMGHRMLKRYERYTISYRKHQTSA